MIDWDRNRVMAFDFETSGTEEEYALQPWRQWHKTGWVTSLAVSWWENDKIIHFGGLDPSVDDMRTFLTRAVRTQSYVVGWNTPFDIGWLLAYGLEDLVFKTKFLDGMLLWRHATIEPEYDVIRTKRKSYSLKACVKELLPEHKDYEANIDFHDTSPEARARLHAYNIKDTDFTLICAEHWFNLLTPAQRQAALIEAECLPMVAQANLQGLCVDELAVKELQAYLKQQAADAFDKLKDYGVTEEALRSPQQLSDVLFGEWKLSDKDVTTTKAGKKSTSKAVLHELAKTDSRAAHVRAYREAMNNCAKFADTPLESVAYNGDGRTRPQARVFGTYSGRLTYDSKQGRGVAARQTGFALHQEKRSAEYRRIIVPPEGYTLVEFDAAGQEFRWMALASGDDAMLALCQEGQDAHAFMGSRIAGIKYEILLQKLAEGDPTAKQQRHLGKIANLSLQYRTSANKFMQLADVQYNLVLDKSQAQSIVNKYKTAYKNVPKYWGEQIKDVEDKGYVETFAGRRVQVTGDWDTNRWAMGSTAINYRIQGTGADQKYLALSVLKDQLVHIGGYFAWDLHDGIYMYIPDAKLEIHMAVLQMLLNNLPYHKAWGYTPSIPLHWDGKYGKSWGALKEFKNA